MTTSITPVAPDTEPVDEPEPTGAPMVVAERLTTEPDNDSLLVLRCPFCGSGTHLHGGTGKDKPLGAGDGLVLAHCGRGTYYIKEIPRAA